jgi:hypothetical protein
MGMDANERRETPQGGNNICCFSPDQNARQASSVRAGKDSAHAEGAFC